MVKARILCAGGIVLEMAAACQYVWLLWLSLVVPSQSLTWLVAELFFPNVHALLRVIKSAALSLAKFFGAIFVDHALLHSQNWRCQVFQDLEFWSVVLRMESLKACARIVAKTSDPSAVREVTICAHLFPSARPTKGRPLCCVRLAMENSLRISNGFHLVCTSWSLALKSKFWAKTTKGSS